MFNECRHIKNDGQRCRAAALKGKPYCFFHMKFDRIYKRDRIEMPPIEDSTSVLLAIGQVIRALNYETMDCKRAGLMLYGLQIAATVTARKEQTDPAECVRSIHDLDGKPLEFSEAFFMDTPMLAPENSVCEPPHDCADCSQKNSCKKPDAVIDRDPGDALNNAFEEPDPSTAERRKHVFAYGNYLDEQEEPRKNMPPPTTTPELISIHAAAPCRAEAYAEAGPRHLSSLVRLQPHPSRTERRLPQCLCRMTNASSPSPTTSSRNSTNFGPHPGFRPAHAKGLMLSGTFTPASGAASLTKAPHIARESTPVTARFSNSTGLPEIPDSNPKPTHAVFAIRFNLADHVHTDIVSHSTDGFPTRDGYEFLDFLRAAATSGPKFPLPNQSRTSSASHPAALRFVQTPKPFPSSLARDTYFGVTAFRFTNAGGETATAAIASSPKLATITSPTTRSPRSAKTTTTKNSSTA